MIRAIGFAFIFPLLLVIMWRGAPPWAVIGAWVVGFSLLGYGWYHGRLVLHCPYCGKGVRIGATHCHHCGRQVVES